MYHGNAARTGDDRFDRRLLPIKPAWSTQLDGAVYGQPLVWSRRVLAVTENDTVYALDGHDGHVLWSRHLGSPMRNVVAQVGCGNIDPLGITSTPVIDTTTHTIFVVGAIQDANKVIHHQLVGMDVNRPGIRGGSQPWNEDEGYDWSCEVEADPAAVFAGVEGPCGAHGVPAPRGDRRAARQCEAGC